MEDDLENSNIVERDEEGGLCEFFSLGALPFTFALDFILNAALGRFGNYGYVMGSFVMIIVLLLLLLQGLLVPVIVRLVRRKRSGIVLSCLCALPALLVFASHLYMTIHVNKIVGLWFSSFLAIATSYRLVRCFRVDSLSAVGTGCAALIVVCPSIVFTAMAVTWVWKIFF